MIEAGAGAVELATTVERHVAQIATRIGRPPDRAILGCTHYEMVADMFRAALKPGTPLIHQPQATADALVAYLSQHPEYNQGNQSGRTFLTTGSPGTQHALVETFWGGSLRFEQA
jgi:glutamate racemase